MATGYNLAITPKRCGLSMDQPQNKRSGQVAEYLAANIDLLTKRQEKTQRQIAIECGYDGARSNIISMFKQGLTRLPINKVGPMAKALGTDPIHLLRLVLGEYNPETWEVLEALLPNKLVSGSEQQFLDCIRQRAGKVDVVPETDDELAMLTALVDAVVARKHAEWERPVVIVT